MLRKHGPEQLKIEVIRPASPPVLENKPFYELRGEQQSRRAAITKSFATATPSRRSSRC
jgi:hypothetical protein